MKKSYTKTKWVDGKTPINAQNLNKLEEAVKYLYDTAIESSFIQEGQGIKISSTGKISVDDGVLQSESVKGIEVITDISAATKRGIIYLLLNQQTLKLDRIILNGVTIVRI